MDYRTKTKKKEYRASSKICKDCSLKLSCLGKSTQEKKFSVTYYREEYERNIERVNSKKGRYMKSKRQSTVEPVFGTLTQFMGLRKINTIGIQQANKVMHMSAIAYNLKKYLKFIVKNVKVDTKVIGQMFSLLKDLFRVQIKSLELI
ncbi:transposase [Flavicella sp.]|uniref:transposase n=1 Tax=Flavicella sp. TaxID=2957742 RepID=UPI0030188B2B